MSCIGKMEQEQQFSGVSVKGETHQKLQYFQTTSCGVQVSAGRNRVKLICINKPEHYLSGVNQANAVFIKKDGTGATVSPESRCNWSNGSGVQQQLQPQLHLSLQVGSSAGRSASKPVSYYPTRLPRSLNIHHKIAAQRGSSDAGRGFPSAPRVVNLRLLRLLQFTL